MAVSVLEPVAQLIWVESSAPDQREQDSPILVVLQSSYLRVVRASKSQSSTASVAGQRGDDFGQFGPLTMVVAMVSQEANIAGW